MEEFVPITTQEEFDAKIKDRINRERETLAKKYSDYEDLKAKNVEYEASIADYSKQLEEAKKEAANFDNERNELTTKIKSYEADSVKTRIALEQGLPYELAKKLSGETEEEIVNDAIKLKEVIGQINKQVAPLADNEPTSVDSKSAALKQLANSLGKRE